MDAIAVTFGPGLATSLLVGLAAAKGLALRLDRPLIGVHHLEAHILSAFLGAGAPRVETVCPFTALVVSGGHTCLMRVEQLGGVDNTGMVAEIPVVEFALGKPGNW